MISTEANMDLRQKEGCPPKISEWIKEGISQRRYQEVKVNSEGAEDFHKLFLRQYLPEHSTNLGFNGKVENHMKSHVGFNTKCVLETQQMCRKGFSGLMKPK